MKEIADVTPSPSQPVGGTLTGISGLKWSQGIALIFVLFAAGGLVLSQLNLLPSLATWVWLFFICVAAGLIYTVVEYRRAPGAPSPAESAAPAAANSLARVVPWLLLIPGFLAMLLSVRMQLSFHGYLMSGYVAQILNGNIPPENVLFPGFPANYYWHYHALVAALTRVTQTPPPLVATILSIIVLIITVVLLMELQKHLQVTERRPAVLTVLAFFSLFGMNLFGMLHAAARFSPAGQTLPTALTDLAPQALFGDGRLNGGLDKYLSFGGYPFGLLAYVVVLLVVVRFLSGDRRGSNILLGIVATVAGFALHTTESVFVLATVPLALTGTYLGVALLEGHLLDAGYHRDRLRALWQGMRQQWPWTLAIGLTTLVLGAATASFLLGASGGYEVRLDLISGFHLKSAVSLVYPLIPFFLIAGVYAIRTRDSRIIFLSLVALGGLALGYLTRVGNNEYKFTFAAGIAMAIVVTVPIWQYVFKPGGRQTHRVGFVAGAFMIGLMFLNITVIGLSQLASPWVWNDNFVANGIHIDSRAAYEGTPYPEKRYKWTANEDEAAYESDLQYADVFQWARGNTAPDAVLVTPMTHRDISTLLLLSERVPYVIDGETMNSGLPGYDGRVADVNTIFSGEGDTAGALDNIRNTLPGRDKYLLYPTSAIAPADPTTHGLTLVYEGRFANLYRIEADNG